MKTKISASMTATPMMIQGEMPIHAALPVCFLLLSPENAPLII